jgi:PPOX class probable F420-dependent enzyme
MLARMFEERPDIQARLDEESIVWMTTVNAAGQPQTSPVWFIVQGASLVVYSLPRTPRTRNIAANPRVSLNLNSTPDGGSVVVIEGLAHIDDDGPPASDDLDYIAKYADAIADLDMDALAFSTAYPVRIRIEPTRLRAS